jgi:hypothetical protein
VPKKLTVELPKFVQRIINGSREYFYFQKGRGSATPGPRLKLPKGRITQSSGRLTKAISAASCPPRVRSMR